MIIVWGTNHYKLKKVTRDEFPLLQEGHHVQLRQRYFHLIFLPLFPIGKAWVYVEDKRPISDSLMDFLNRESVVYDVPLELQQELEFRYPPSSFNKKHLWKSFIGPLLLLYIWIHNMID